MIIIIYTMLNCSWMKLYFFEEHYFIQNFTGSRDGFRENFKDGLFQNKFECIFDLSPPLILSPSQNKLEQSVLILDTFYVFFSGCIWFFNAIIKPRPSSGSSLKGSEP